MNRKIKQKIINILEYTPMLLLLLRRSIFILKRSYEFFISIVFLPLPIKNNKIVFLNYYGKGVGDNAKYIYNEGDLKYYFESYKAKIGFILCLQLFP